MGKRGFKDGLFVGGYRPNTIDDFWAKIDIRGEDECWEWQGGERSRGYGGFRYRGNTVSAHRFSYELVSGEIPDGMIVMHACDNPGCCNPAHLSLGTPTDNMTDRHNKGRYARGSQHSEARLNEENVLEIVRQLDEGRTQASVAIEYGVTRSTINHISTGRNWAWLTGRRR